MKSGFEYISKNTVKKLTRRLSATSTMARMTFCRSWSKRRYKKYKIISIWICEITFKGKIVFITEFKFLYCATSIAYIF